MWLEKIRRGVLEIETDTGLQYVEPTFGERVRLLWTFRNFHVLPTELLNEQERQLVGDMCKSARLKRALPALTPPCVIGTVDLHRPKKPNGSVKVNAKPQQRAASPQA